MGKDACDKIMELYLVKGCSYLIHWDFIGSIDDKI